MLGNNHGPVKAIIRAEPSEKPFQMYQLCLYRKCIYLPATTDILSILAVPPAELPGSQYATLGASQVKGVNGKHLLT